ncbi:peptidase HslV family [Escherichia coli]
MTTIAWDGKTLASDTQATSGDVVCSYTEQKIYTPPESGWEVCGSKVVALGCSGDCGAEMELQELLKNNLTYASEFLPTFSFTALAITGAGRAYIISKEKGETRASISLQVEPYAIGSGGLIARTAMHCGKNAREAVQVAIDLDCHSGGSVDSFPAGKQTEGE